MDSSEDIEPVTVLKRDAAALIERARDRSAPILITQNGRATAVLQDIESFERQRKALLLLKLMAMGEQDAREGRTSAHGGVDKAIRKRLKQAKG